MELEVFRKKLKELYEKSEMDMFIEWPFVYDMDEQGNIYVDEKGIFWFADACYNWIKSHLNLNDVVTLRYAKCHEEGGFDNFEEYEILESYIYIYFASGESMQLCNERDTYTVEVCVKFRENEKNCALIENIKALRNREFSVEIIK